MASHAVVRYPQGYEYVDLSNAERRIGGFANIFGIVTEWDAPRKTRKADLICTLKLVDPSLNDTRTEEQYAVELSVFAPDRAQLPHFRKPGDIIRLHRVRINLFNGRLQLVASLGAQARGFGNAASFCIFDGSIAPNADPHQPYQTSSRTYHFDPREAAILAHLRAFVQSGEWRSRDHGAEKYLRRINNVMLDAPARGMAFADLVACVLAVTPTTPGPGIAWVWDATDAPPFPPDDSTDTTTGPDGQGVADELRTALLLQRKIFPMSELPPAAAAALPSLGTAVPIFFRGNILELPQPGTWVKLRNCGFQVAEGQLQGVITGKSRLLQWHEDEVALQEYARRLAQKELSSWNPGTREQWKGSTVHIDRELTSLRHVFADSVTLGGRPMAYRSLVRVLSYWPSRTEIETACVPARASWEAAQAEGYSDSEQWLFAVRLRVVDGTGTVVDVDVFGVDGQEFFHDVIPPQDLRTSPEAKARLVAALDGLMNSRTRDEPPKWLELSFRSFFPEIQNGMTAGRREARYRLFETRLKYPS